MKHKIPVKTQAAVFLSALSLGGFSQVSPRDSSTLREVEVVDKGVIPSDSTEFPDRFSGIQPENPQLLSQNDRLNLINGVSALQGAGNTAKLSYRGIGARSQYTTSGSMLYLGEIPLTSAEGFSTYEDIYPGWIHAAGLPIHGSQTYLGKAFYPNALGAILLMEPVNSGSDTGRSEIRYKGSAGSFGFRQNAINGRVISKNYRSFLGFEDSYSEGWRENSQLRRQSLFTNHQWSLQGDKRIQLLLYGIKNFSQIPSSLNIEDFSKHPRAAAENWKSIQGYEEYEKVTTGITFDHDPKKSRFAYSITGFYHFRHGFEPRPFNILEEHTHSAGTRLRGRLKGYEIFGREVSLQMFAEYIYDNHHAQTFENLYDSLRNKPNIVGPTIENTVFRNQRINAGITYSSAFSEALRYDVGLKFFYQHRKIRESEAFNVPLIPAPSLSLAYERSGKSETFYLNIYRSYGIPSIEENLDPDGSLNPGLEPEKSWTGEIRWEKVFRETWPLGVNIYYMEVRNLIIPRAIAEDQVIATNSGSSIHSGLEVSFSPSLVYKKHRIDPAAGGYFGYFRYQSFRDTTGIYDSHELPGFPDRQFNLSLSYTYDQKWVFGILGRYTGAYFVNDRNTVKTQDYFLLQSWVKARLEWRNWQLIPTFGVRNIGDVNYAAMTVVNNSAFGTSLPRYYYPGNPINWFASVELAYQF